MSITQLNMIFAIGEAGLLFLVIVFALVSRWAAKRETAREIAQLPVYQPKLHGLEGPATRAAAQFMALNADSASLQTVRQLETALAKESVETVKV